MVTHQLTVEQKIGGQIINQVVNVFNNEGEPKRAVDMGAFCFIKDGTPIYCAHEDVPMEFLPAIMAHEMGHIISGHLDLDWKTRLFNWQQLEIEADMFVYISGNNPQHILDYLNDKLGWFGKWLSRKRINNLKEMIQTPFTETINFQEKLQENRQ
jgi:hypothetical protein